MEKKYFFKTLLISIIMGICVVGLWFIYLIKFFPIVETTYVLGHIDKMEKLKEKNEEKRLLFFGGSNIAFGINSEILETSFLEYKVLNIGTHASLGVRYPLNEIDKYLKKGDKLFLSLEYDSFFSGGYGGTSLWELIAYRKSLNMITCDEVLNIFFSSLNIFKTQLNARISSKFYGKIFTYDRRGFNKYGDYIEQTKFYFLNKIQAQKWNEKEKIDEDFIIFLKQFIEKNEKKGVQIYFIPPALEVKTGIKNKKIIKKIEERIQKENLKYLGKSEEFFMEEDLIYDTIYHLNKKGRDRRTIQIKEIIKNYSH